jgi:hypothetical protein
MLQTLDQARPLRHAFHMATTRPAAPGRRVDPGRLKVGQALRILRDRLGLSQEQAAAGHADDFSKQHWGSIENGHLRGIYDPGVQQGLIDALNTAAPPGSEPLTLEDLDAVMAEMSGGPAETAASRLRRLATEVGATGGVAERPTPFDGGMVEAVFPTRDGPVTFRYPSHMTPEGLRELEAYFAVFLQAAKRDEPSLR